MSCNAIVIAMIAAACIASLLELYEGWRNPPEIVKKDDWDGGLA